MNHDYTVSAALPTDLEAILEILRLRQQWLSERHIVQWEGYENFFPRSYFEGKLAEGKLLVARDTSGTVCGLIALADQDPYWVGKERPGALYLHNLASAPGARGAGAALLDYCQQWAQEHGYQVLRLDCRADNQALNEYYSARGFRPVGFCTDRTHRGTLREKEL